VCNGYHLRYTRLYVVNTKAATCSAGTYIIMCPVSKNELYSSYPSSVDLSLVLIVDCYYWEASH
jgi:hypothetical protein